MKPFNIYSEEIKFYNDFVPAKFIGTGFGKTFEEAVHEYFSRNPSHLFDPKRMTLWGCRLFTEPQP